MLVLLESIICENQLKDLISSRFKKPTPRDRTIRNDLLELDRETDNSLWPKTDYIGLFCCSGRHIVPTPPLPPSLRMSHYHHHVAQQLEGRLKPRRRLRPIHSNLGEKVWEFTAEGILATLGYRS